MRLLYVANTKIPWKTAHSNQIMNMCEAFRQNKADVTLLIFKSAIFKSIPHLMREYNVIDKFNVVLLDNKQNFKYYLREFILFFKFLSMKDKFDVVYSRSLFFSLLVKLICPKKKLFYELHDLSKGSLWNSLFRSLFNKTEKVIVISEGLRDTLIRKKLDEKKVVVCHDGVNMRKFDISMTQRTARKMKNIPLRRKIVMYIGSFHRWKGVHIAIKTFNKMKDKNIYLYIIGGHDEEIRNIKNRVKNPNIIFLGFKNQQEVPAYLKAADALLIPNSKISAISTTYTSPLKLFEYMAVKRPVIASDLPSIKNIVSDKEVLFFKADNTYDLLVKIKTLLSDTKLQKKLVENAYKKVKNFSWKNRAKRILELF